MISDLIIVWELLLLECSFLMGAFVSVTRACQNLWGAFEVTSIKLVPEDRRSAPPSIPLHAGHQGPAFVVGVAGSVFVDDIGGSDAVAHSGDSGNVVNSQHGGLINELLDDRDGSTHLGKRDIKRVLYTSVRLQRAGLYFNSQIVNGLQKKYFHLLEVRDA
jgi:hypothetical protein